MPDCPACGVHYVPAPGVKCPACRQRDDFHTEVHELAIQANRRRMLLDSIPERQLRKLDKRIRKQIKAELGRSWRECPYAFAMGLSCNCDFCRRYWPLLEEAAPSS
jgi:hypothetical protein